MYKISSLFVLLSLFTAGCRQATDHQPDPAAGIQVNWTDEKQTIEGFGIAQAGWADPLFSHFRREEVMEELFGPSGLKLNILRGEVFPHYWENEQDKDFNLDDPIDMPLTDSIFTQRSDDLLRRGQLWVTRVAHDRYQVEKLLFSVWSAPAYMKTNGKVSDGELKPESYQDFADYLAAFYKAYRSAGLTPYALSPSNEPGYAAPWNSSLWTPEKMGRFITRNLGPTFRKEQIPARIVFGENPFWSAVSEQAAFVSSLAFVNRILELYPEITGFHPIAAGHGYTLPDSYPAPKDSLLTPVVPFTEAEKKGIPVWVTEISETGALDTTITDGVKWAATFHEFLTVGNVNAFIWWGGALPTTNNESLVVLDPDRRGYRLTKRFHTFGNFTRYIPEGSKRVGTTAGSTADSLLVSAYKNGKDFTLVAVNPTDRAIRTTLRLTGAKMQGVLQRYLTDATGNWQPSSVGIGSKGAYTLEVPASGVATFTGSIDSTGTDR